MGIGRKFQDVCWALTPLEEQGKIEDFFNNIDNANKLGGLVEDIRDAMVEYQACVYSISISGTSEVRTRLRYSKISITRVVDSS